MEREEPRIDRLVRAALKAFTKDFTQARWWGKEHDWGQGRPAGLCLLPPQVQVLSVQKNMVHLETVVNLMMIRTSRWLPCFDLIQYFPMPSSTEANNRNNWQHLSIVTSGCLMLHLKVPLRYRQG